MKKALLIIAGIIVLFIIIFWGRIGSSVDVYSIVSNVTNALNSENDSYTLYIEGNLNLDNKSNTLSAGFSYKRGDHFLADVYYNDSRYSIIRQGDSTQVYIGSANSSEDKKDILYQVKKKQRRKNLVSLRSLFTEGEVIKQNLI